MAIHEFTERTLVKFFWEDLDEMGYPCLGVAHLPGERVAEFTAVNGFCLPFAITFDVVKVNTAYDLCEHIAHELVHGWQHALEYPMGGNIHEENFHLRMADLGIATEGKNGMHRGYIGDVWADWLEQTDAVDLQRFRLGEPDADASED